MAGANRALGNSSIPAPEHILPSGPVPPKYRKRELQNIQNSSYADGCPVPLLTTVVIGVDPRKMAHGEYCPCIAQNGSISLLLLGSDLFSQKSRK